MKKNKNGIWVNDKNEPITWWNPYEGDIIGPYLQFIGDFSNWPRYQMLEFKDGTILYVSFDGYGDSDNDLDLFDTFNFLISFSFNLSHLIGKL